MHEVIAKTISKGVFGVTSVCLSQVVGSMESLTAGTKLLVLVLGLIVSTLTAISITLDIVKKYRHRKD